MKIAIELENVHYRTPRKSLLREISMRAHYGEFWAIVGPNGAGKSTLLRLLSGDLSPVIGNINLHGQPLKTFSNHELAQKRAILMQKTEIALPFRVEEVVMMGRYPYFHTQPGPEDHKAVNNALRRVGIEHLYHRFYASLSGGEQQRVQIARVLAQIQAPEQTVLLLDEPLNNLDIRFQLLTLEIAREYAAKGSCVVLVLHDLNLAARYADQLLLLHEGRSLAQGQPAEVLNTTRLREAFQIEAELLRHPASAQPFIFSKHAIL